VSRAYDFTVLGILSIICVVVHLMAVELLGPSTELFALATEGTENVNGTENAYLWYQIIAIYAPFGSFVGMIAWAVVREYRRAVSTAARDAGRRP
jgi:hypothetical protein